MSEKQPPKETGEETPGEKELAEELEAVDREVNPQTGEAHGEPEGRDAERREQFKRLYGGEHEGGAVNPAFVGSSAVGQAWAHANDGQAKEAGKALTRAAELYTMARVPAAAAAARELAGESPVLSARIADAFHQTMQPAFMAQDVKSYHAASLGFTLGLAEWSARLMKQQSDVGEAKTMIGKWLSAGPPHAAALKAMDDRMAEVSAEYASASNCIAACHSWGAFGNCVQLIERVADRVGKGIP